MNAFLRSLAICAELVAATSAAAVGQVPADSVIERIIRDRVEGGRSAGIVIGVIDADGAQRVVGWPKQLSGVHLDERAVFEVGSIAKVFTAILLAEMVERGEVRFDDPISDYMPRNVRIPQHGDVPITLGDLATHLSGLPGTPANLNPADPMDPFADYTINNLYEFLNTYELTRDVGTQWAYSNTGAALLGHILSRHAGRSFESLLAERVLVPLSLRDTTPFLAPALAGRLVPGHDVSGNPVSPWNLGVFTPAGGLWSTAEDLLRFLEVNLRPDASPVGRSLASTHSVRHVITPEASMALGWIRYTEDQDTVLWHPGETGGYHTFMGINPSRGTGVVVLSSSRTSIDDIGFHLLLPNSPLEDPLSHIVGRKKLLLSEREMERYIGQYVFPSGEALVIRLHEDKLFGMTKWSRFQLHPEAPDRFFVYDFPADIAFEAGPDGVITHLIRTMNGQEQRATRVRR